VNATQSASITVFDFKFPRATECMLTSQAIRLELDP